MNFLKLRSWVIISKINFCALFITLLAANSCSLSFFRLIKINLTNKNEAKREKVTWTWKLVTGEGQKGGRASWVMGGGDEHRVGRGDGGRMKRRAKISEPPFKPWIYVSKTISGESHT